MAANVIAFHKLKSSIDEFPAQEPHSDETELKQRLSSGMTVAGVVVLATLGWGSVAKLSSAVIATGTVVIEANSKKVQHQQGGVVSEILVKNGSKVVAGETVVRLDDTQTRASLGVISSQLIELEGRKARLAAERDTDSQIKLTPEFLEMGPDAMRIAEGERRLFQVRKTAADGRKSQIKERVKQFEEEISGYAVQRHAKVREMTLIKEELGRVTDMYNRRLMPVTRVLTLQRDEARLDGENGTLIAQIGRLRGQITEAHLQHAAIDQTTSSEAQKELREIEAKVSELQERRIAAEDQLRRVELNSPISGLVHELSVHSVGGVVTPGEQLMMVVPDDDALSVEVRLQTTDIDQVWVGQGSILRFPAFNQRVTPELKGTVIRVSPDVSRETQSNQVFYTARITPNPDELQRLSGKKLMPGMPVEAFIETPPRTALSYFMKPLMDSFRRSFRDR
jgi:HlyD family secretion protein